MQTFFLNRGPFDINYLLKFTLFTKKKKLKKKLIANISTLIDSKKNDITFLDNIKYVDRLNESKASFCFVKDAFVKNIKNKSINLIISKKPLIDFMIISRIFYPDADKDNFTFKLNPKYKDLKSKFNTMVDKSVKIGKNFKIGLGTVLKKNIIIGDNVTIGSNCTISNSIIGNNVTINDGTVLGKIGYGFKNINNKIEFIPHIGCVKIYDNVYIGSNCTIDRGSFGNTIIGSGTMIDNQVHIAHNVKIGSLCFIAGQVGIAGSTVIGNNCLIGGQAGISGHLKIGDNVYVGGNSGVIRDIENNAKIMGYPASSLKNFIKSMEK